MLAGAGAAVTSALLGSFFGADGTIVGAAFGSVASTVAATVYQRSLDRTRETLVARVRVRRNPADPAHRSDSEMTVRLPPVDADGADRPVLDEPAPRGRRWLLWVGATVLVFALAMATITGIELAKGSTITGNDQGTSVGRVVERPPAAPEEEEEPGSTGTDSDTTATPEPTADPESPTTATPDPDAPGGAEGDSRTQEDDEQAPEDDPGGSVDIRPTERDTPGETPATPDSGARTGAGGGAGPNISNHFGSGLGDRFGTDVEETTVAPPTTRP
ncbi:hypothetical protein [Pseudonocardia lacus]|uniref:hypothetical protein n=1 Tax=Pseudonocardia lacus TaxID=2835865 RepID=UPI001BDCCF28|nr:hypothetical protein [Pseudonocardia lacus]